MFKVRDETGKQNYINHIVFALDASASMRRVEHQVTKVVDAEIAHLARRSRELNQETRVTVYAFSDRVSCLFYDTDVLRLPSTKDVYRPSGMTALVDAAMASQIDLASSAQLYGDHAFLTYVLTDGQENASINWTSHDLARHIDRQADNWTLACLVPDQRGVFEAKKHGFPAGNIAVWDATTERGVSEAVETTIRGATETFMVNRASGVRGSKTIFAGGVAQVNTQNVRATMGFNPLSRQDYVLAQGASELPEEIRPFVEAVTLVPYRKGNAYYELMKPEKIQAYKNILVRNRRSGRVYSSADSRKLLGLPNEEVRVKPEHNPQFQIFVQSTSVNRKIPVGSKVVILL